MKSCTKCGEPKSLDDFGPDRRRKDGKQSNCRACCRIYDRTNPDRIAKHAVSSAVYREENPDYQRSFQQRPEAKISRRTRQNDRPASVKKREQFLRRLKKYGISETAYLEAELIGCAICGTKDPGYLGSLHIDHDHSTGEVRGLLCHSCNVLLGHARDSVDTLQKAIQYLRNERTNIK